MRGEVGLYTRSGGGGGGTWRQVNFFADDELIFADIRASPLGNDM